MIPRSWLFCPAERTDRLAKAVTAADVAVADLEDAVPIDRKEAARAALIPALQADRDAAARTWVRVNNDTQHLADDLEALRDTDCAGIVVPKAEPTVIERVGRTSTLPLLALVETADGLWQARDIAAHPQVHSLTLGEYDLAAELGLARPEDDPQPLHWARSRIVAAAAAARCAAPPAPVSTVISDSEWFADDTAALGRFGFFGRMCIHPAQVSLTHTTLTPGDDAIAQARTIVHAAEQAERDGSGVVVVNGSMVDAPIVRKARQILELAERS